MGIGDEGSVIVIPCGLKCEEKEQSLSRGAGVVGRIRIRPRALLSAVSTPARGINHLVLDTLEIQLLLHASHRK